MSIGDHVRGAHCEGGLHSAQPDRPEAKHGCRIAGLQAAFGGGVVAGAHHVAGEQRDVIAHALGHLAQHQVGARHERLLGLRALQRAERRAVPERARGVALVKQATQAEEAMPAGGLKAAEHAVADAHLVHLIADGGDRADVLVPDRKARFDLHATVVDVQVRATHAARLDADDRVCRLEQLGLGDVLDANFPGRLEGDGTHRRPP